MTKKILNILMIIFGIICVCGIVYSLYNIFNWKKDVDSNKKLKIDIEKKIKFDEDDNKLKIDFNALKAQNPDTVGYIKVNGTDIDYVVVKTGDNDYYLNHDFNKNYNSAGWIFADYRNKFDTSDNNIVIYGHNMRDGSMFGTLKNILKSDWQNDINNREIVLVTELGQYRYQVFSVYSRSAEEYYINTDFNTTEEYISFINEMKYRSFYDFGVEVNEFDKILTLSSCIGYGSDRVVLHAKLINDAAE